MSFIFALLVQVAVANENKACILETNTTFMGMKLDIQDCIENSGMKESDFKNMCKSYSQAAVSMGGPAAKLTYKDKCPTPFQAKCDNSKSAKTVFFYYKRAADEFKSLPSSCKMMGGTYTKGTLPAVN